jgi:hypothetical protein
VSIVGSRAKEDWEMKVEGPSGFERSYTLVGSAGEHQPVAIGNLLLTGCCSRRRHKHRQPTSFPEISGVYRPSADEAEIENDFQKKCRKGAKFAAHTAFSAILGEISCLFSLA